MDKHYHRDASMIAVLFSRSLIFIPPETDKMSSDFNADYAHKIKQSDQSVDGTPRIELGKPVEAAFGDGVPYIATECKSLRTCNAKNVYPSHAYRKVHSTVAVGKAPR